MEICETQPVKTIPKPSVIFMKNKNLGHDECCNCGCCSSPQPTCYKYVQPEVPKSFAPVRKYAKPAVALDSDTTYKLSFWEGPISSVQPFKPQHSLRVSQCPFSDDTTHKLSYLGNWCVKPEEPIIPCSRQWLGRGPIQCATTQKCDFTWKNIDPTKPIKARPNLYRPRGAMENDTTYRMSYFNSACVKRVEPFRPVRKYVKSDVPMEGCTTYKLSYWANEVPMKETFPWQKQAEYQPPVEKMENDTTYNLSYWPHCEKPAKPIIVPDTENLINAGCCFDDKTTYKLSYFGCGGDRRQPIRQSQNINLSTCPLSHDTVNRLSYLGNWCFKPESMIRPCKRDWLGRGPMQKETTQKCDFYWKCPNPNSAIRPQNNLKSSSKPMEFCTTQKMSFAPNDSRCLMPVKSFAPVRKYVKSTAPLETDTVQRLSYQPVEPAEKVDVAWTKKGTYQRPTTSMEDNTTYNLSYIPPGQLIPLCQPESAPSEAAPLTCEMSEPQVAPICTRVTAACTVPEPQVRAEFCKMPEPPTLVCKTPEPIHCKMVKPLPVFRPKPMHCLPQIKEPYFSPCLMSMPRPCITCGSS